ncbi:MAG: hypothetical protein WCY21_00375 [Candidatus Cloacimonadaceae bacterium]|nr:hypothetical protein [Candidatus Cloacimonadota bacterium]MDX9948924.1 hypothetical protein [Candidatus Syntrophosphaera sp.]NLN84674.1 hypothetical protein [Candidatus Cloacimonadota bacterium]
MKFRNLILLLCLILLTSCMVKRNNPLDPIGNPDIIVPDQVSGLQCFASGVGATNKYVELRWNANPSLNTDGYYIYMGLAYNSEYAVVDTVTTNVSVSSHGGKPWHSVKAGDYWYKVAAFRDVYDEDGKVLGKLEGRRSEPRFIRVPA